MGEMHDPGNESLRKRGKRGGGGGGGGSGEGDGDGNGNGHGGPAEEARLRQLLDALTAAQRGDFDVRLPFTRGSGLMAEIARAFRGAFPDLHMEVDLILVDGDVVAARWTTTGTSSRPGSSGSTSE